MEQRKKGGKMRSDELGSRVTLGLVRVLAFTLLEMKSHWRDFSRGVI